MGALFYSYVISIAAIVAVIVRHLFKKSSE
jgi:hypothetical protein